MAYTVSKKTLCNLIWECGSKEKEAKINYIVQTLKLQDSYTKDQILKIKEKLSNCFYPHYYSRWQAAHRLKKYFEEKYNSYINEEFIINLEDSADNQNVRNEEMEVEHNDNVVSADEDVTMEDISNISHSRGRPVVQYKNASKRTKKRRANELAENHSTPELGLALKKRKICIIKNELDLKDMKSYMFMSRVLAMYVDCKFTYERYHQFRKHNFAITSCNPYPSYKSIIKTKRESFPNEMYITEDGAEANLFHLLENTVKKIILQQNPEERAQLSRSVLHLDGKWGMDGASGQQTTRQKWSSNKQAAMLPIDADVNEEYYSANPVLVAEELNDNFAVDAIFDDDEDVNTHQEPVIDMSDKNVFGTKHHHLSFTADQLNSSLPKRKKLL